LTVDISVIIPTFNEEACIKRTLEAISDQSADFDYEVLVCDGGSTDRTRQIASRYAKVVVSPSRGQAAQSSFGANVSRGSILVFIDADTMIPKNYLQHVYRAFENDKDLLACGAPISYSGNGPSIRLGNILCKINRYFFINFAMYMWYVSRNLLCFTEIPGCNLCVRKDVYYEVGGFKQPLPNMGMDVSFGFALRELSKKKGVGKLKILRSLVVWASPRHISVEKSIRRLKNYRRIIDVARGVRRAE